MEIGKRFAFLVALAGINLVFSARSVSLATQDAVPSINVNSAQDMAISNGAVLAKASLPEEEIIYQTKTKRTVNMVITGYSSSVNETDSTPYITASGTFVRPGVAASNVLPFGTKFRIPEFFGDTVFTVEDRMNSRYNGKNWVDVWFGSKAKAQTFGREVGNVEIL